MHALILLVYFHDDDAEVNETLTDLVFLLPDSVNRYCFMDEVLSYHFSLKFLLEFLS